MSGEILIRVDVDTTLFVYCEPKKLDVQAEVTSCIGDHLSGNCRDIFFNGVCELKDVPRDWENSYPYGDNAPDKTCLEIVNEMIEEENKRKIAEELEKKQIKFPFYGTAAQM